MAAWFDSLPADFTLDVNGVATPAKDVPFIKEAPDMTTFVKGAYDAHREVGARIPIKIDRVRNNDGTFAPSAEGIENWRKTHLPKLYDAGVLARPPGSPDEYEIKKPEKLPDGINWNDERGKKFATVLHKHGIPKAAVNDLIELHSEALTAGWDIFKNDEKVAEATLRKEFPTDYDARMEASKRLTKLIFKEPGELELLEAAGVATHPRFLSVLMRLAPLAAQDRSLGLQMESGGGVTREQVQSELADIMQNDKNPRHKLYRSGDPATLEYVQSLYKKLPGGNEKVVIG